MRTLSIYFMVISLLACRNRPSTKTTVKSVQEINQYTDQDVDSSRFFSEESLELNREKTKSIKREQLLSTEDDKTLLQELVISKKFYKEDDFYILDYKYPYLNEEIDASYAIFNNYISENYLNIEATENEILEDKVIFCDSLGMARCTDKRIIDYKIYTAKNNLISVLLYKENYYSGMKNSTYMFDCLNFNLQNHRFINFSDFFTKDSEEKLFLTINQIIREGIKSGEIYYECWEVSEEDFKVYKNNFVITEDTIEFYFDDCIICPSYTGTYSIEIPITKVMSLIKNYNAKPKVI